MASPQEIFEELQSLDPANVGSWPNYLYIALAVIILFAIAGIGINQFGLPKQAELEKAEKKELSLRATFEAKQKKIANLDAYKAQLEEMERSFGAMLRQLPSKSEVANLLNDIAQTRVASGLEEELFKPQSEVKKDFYSVIPNKITVLGDFHEFGTFVSRVSALPRIVNIDEVEIQQSRGKDGRSQLRMNALAKTYRYLESDEGEE